jgi:hypothetical protein
MAATIHVQTRLSPGLVTRLDQRAGQTGITRAELLRTLLEAALEDEQPVNNITTDPLLAEIADEMGALIARVEACHLSARRAHAAATIAGLMLLPAERRQDFLDQLAKEVRP